MLTSTDISATRSTPGRVLRRGGPAAALLPPGEMVKSLVGPMASSGVAVLPGGTFRYAGRRYGSMTHGGDAARRHRPRTSTHGSGAAVGGPES